MARGITIILAFLTLGCDLFFDSTDPLGNPSIALTIQHASDTVQAGSAGAIVGSVARRGGYGGPVNVQLVGTPFGIATEHYFFTSVAERTEFGVIFDVHPDLAPGRYEIEVFADADRIADVTAPVTLIVAERSGFALNPASAWLTVAAGGSVSLPVSLDRFDFTGPVSLSVPDLPAGITASATIASPGDVTATITFDVAPTVGPSIRVVTIRGEAVGQPGRSLPLVLQVQTGG